MSTAGQDGMKWYLIQTHSGFESRAKAGLEETVRQFGRQDELGQVIVPVETVYEVKNGEKTQRERKLYPGYILAQMKVSKEMWHAVKATPRIIGFISGAHDPVSLSEHEVQKILGQMEEGAKAPKAVTTFQDGDQVRVIDGPFKNFNGVVEEVNPDKAKVRVLVSIFGRATPVELDFVQVEVVG
jgi:transcriptional antiterminator NusG